MKRHLWNEARTGEFRLLKKRNGLENATVLFYGITIGMSLCRVALCAIPSALVGLLWK